MKQNKYISPEIITYSYLCEQGFALSTEIGGWGDGENLNGEAE